MPPSRPRASTACSSTSIPSGSLPTSGAPRQALLEEAGIEVVSGMFRTVGEDYTTMETIRVTGGVAPDATWEQNKANIAATVPIAKQLGMRLVTFHAGFLPHDESDPAFVTLAQRLRDVADMFAAHGIGVGLETGQETAPALRDLLKILDRPTLSVNFDPANMVLYDKGDPIDALRTLGPWIGQVHIKDGIRTKVSGEWGEEVVVGSGDVDWPAFFAALHEVGFTGDLCIEREAGTTVWPTSPPRANWWRASSERAHQLTVRSRSASSASASWA